MISRSTARILGEAFSSAFSQYHRGVPSGIPHYSIATTRLYDFLFDHDYPAWFCNQARSIEGVTDTRALKDFIMRLHTGETLSRASMGCEQEDMGGQEFLERLASDLITNLPGMRDALLVPEPSLGNPYWRMQHSKLLDKALTRLMRALELDGYIVDNGRLKKPEEDVLDAREETGVLQSLYDELGLAKKDTAFHHMGLAEEHYLAELWDDCISNARKFLELTVGEVVAKHSQVVRKTELSKKTYKSPAGVRDYLEKEGLLENKEREALATVYGLLSETGGHPYMAKNDQARLLRHLALTFAQFVMLRLRGALATEV